MHRFTLNSRLALCIPRRPAAVGFVRLASSRPLRLPPNKQRKQISSADVDSLVKSVSKDYFQTALKDGRMTAVTVDEAVVIIQRCLIHLSKHLPESLPGRLSEVIGVDIEKISQAVFILYRNPLYSPILGKLFGPLASDGDARAYWYLRMIKSSHVSKNDTRFTSNINDPVKLTVLGGEASKNGNDKKAAQLFKQAMAMSVPVPAEMAFDALFPSRIEPAWHCYGLQMKKMGDLDAAAEALNIGLTQYDSPFAYYTLSADVLKTGDVPKYEDYLLKAAMEPSLILPFRMLGDLYLSLYLGEMRHDPKTAARGRNRILPHHTNDDIRKMAFEWYDISVTTGDALSAMIMAGFLRYQGKLKQGLKYLEIAEDDSQMAPDAARLRESWHDSRFTVDFGKLTQFSPFPL